MLTEGHLEDLRNHFADGYALGRKDERKKIITLIELDMLTPEAYKERVLSMIMKDVEEDDEDES